MDIPQNLTQTLQLCFSLPILCFLSFTVLKTVNCMSSKSDNGLYNNIIVCLTLLLCVNEIFKIWLRTLLTILAVSTAAPQKTIIIITNLKDEKKEMDDINTEKQENTSENQTTEGQAEESDAPLQFDECPTPTSVASST